MEKLRIFWLPKPATGWVPNGVVRRAKRGRESAQKFGLFHEVTRKFTKVRTDQGRGYAMLRIVTGEALFYER